MKKQDEEKLKKSRDAYLESLFSQLPAEESDSSPLKCKITIRMPQGDRISRTFSSENTLKVPFFLLLSHAMVLLVLCILESFRLHRVTGLYGSESKIRIGCALPSACVRHGRIPKHW